MLLGAVGWCSSFGWTPGSFGWKQKRRPAADYKMNIVSLRVLLYFDFYIEIKLNRQKKAPIRNMT